MARAVGAKKNFQADALLQHLGSWARRADVVNTPYVAGLTAAINAKKDLHIWATLDPMQYLPYPIISIGLRVARLVRILTVLRNVLVFAPVALTWAAVGEATSGFSEYVAENGANVVNFLDFWQNGYGYLGNEWRISTVAQLDFVIIMIVIALTVYISIAGTRASEAQAKLEAEIDSDRTAVAIEIAAFLYSKRQVTNVTMNQSLAATLSKLLNATDALENSSKAIATTSKNFEKASRKITPYA
jgi:hypothetical protein